MNDEDLRRWAIEQVMAHRAGNGFVLSALLAEVQKLINFVKTGKAE